MRGFNDVRRNSETQEQKNSKQQEYDSYIKKYRQNTFKNEQARAVFNNPPYYLKTMKGVADVRRRTEKAILRSRNGAMGTDKETH